MFDILWTGRSTILYRSATRREQARWASSQCHWRSCSERGRRAGPNPTAFKSLFSIVIVRSKHESLTLFFSWNLSSSGEENSCKYRWGCTRTSWCQHGKWLIEYLHLIVLDQGLKDISDWLFCCFIEDARGFMGKPLKDCSFKASQERFTFMESYPKGTGEWRTNWSESFQTGKTFGFRWHRKVWNSLWIY